MSLLMETTRRIDLLVAEGQAQGRTPTLVAGIVRAGALVHFAAAGELLSPERSMQYRIGSITKTMTAVLIMQLRDRGLLDLDDPLEAHLPGTPVGAVTLRQLLGHAGGLQREPEGQWWERADGADLTTLLAGLTPGKLSHPPHRAYHYSNLAYGLLGAVAEALTGRGWAELLTERVLEPLGMTRTTYLEQEPYATGYVVHPWHETLREEPRTDTGAMAPAGQLWSTAEDLARWAAFLASPDPGVLAPQTLAEMCVPVIMSDLDSWRSGHGLGLQLHRVGERVYTGHGGSMPGYVAGLAVHRPTRTGVVTFANAYGLRTGSIGEFTRTLLTTVLDAEPEPTSPWRPRPQRPSPEIDQLCGRWWWMGEEYEFTWDPHRDELVRTRLQPAGGQVCFRHEEGDRWRGTGGDEHGETMTVLRDENGQVTALDIATFVFTRDPDRLR